MRVASLDWAPGCLLCYRILPREVFANQQARERISSHRYFNEP